MQVKNADGSFKSVNHKIARCLFMQQRYRMAISYEKRHLFLNHEKNQMQANHLLFECYLELDKPIQATFYLETAHELGLSDDRYENFQAKLNKKKVEIQLERQDQRERNKRDQAYLDNVKFKFQRLAASMSPIAISNMKQDKGRKFFINGMKDEDLFKFKNSREWQHLKISKPEATKIPFYWSTTVSDERTLYKKFLPIMTDIAQITAFNDYLEDDHFFDNKWKKSKVFSLLLVDGFTPEIIEDLLAQNDLLGKLEFQQLQTCEDLVFLKENGECLPLAYTDKIKNYQLLKDFDHLCFENCGNTIHLRSKCVMERRLLQRLKKVDKKGLPFKETLGNFTPTEEQSRFIDWLHKQKHNVISLLGVGGSGKTYTVGHILDTSRVYALAPTHKARINLSKFFDNNGTIQKAAYDIDRGRSQIDYYYHDVDVILIDEVSMITLEMLDKVLAAFKGYKIILVGDDKQLPPVTKDAAAFEVSGNVMELLQEGQVFYFKENLRCVDEKTKAFIEASRNKNFTALMKAPYQRESREAMLAYKAKHLAVEDCMILAYHNQTVGVINNMMYEKLSVGHPERIPFKMKRKHGRGGFFEGAQVVFYENGRYNYSYKNSEFGVIEQIYQKKGEDGKDYSWVIVRTDYDTYDIPMGIAYDDLLLAYAITIHKAQGSGSKKVYIVESEDYGTAYTAVSRTKKDLVFVNLERETYYQALDTPSAIKRNVQLLERKLGRRFYLVEINPKQWQESVGVGIVYCDYIYNLLSETTVYLCYRDESGYRIVGIARYNGEERIIKGKKKNGLKIIKHFQKQVKIRVPQDFLKKSFKLLTSEQVEYIQTEIDKYTDNSAYLKF